MEPVRFPIMGTGGLFIRKLRATIEDKPTGFVWIEGDKLAGSGYPASQGQVRWLAEQGIKSIVTLTEQPLPEEWLQGAGLTSFHIPMGDHQNPTMESLKQAVALIEAEVSRQRGVVVHCLAGQGRTGCVLAAYIVHSKRIGAGQSIIALRKLKPEFVESQQERAVFEYAKSEGI